MQLLYCSAGAEHNCTRKVVYRVMLQSKQKLYEIASTEKKGEEVLIEEKHMGSGQHLL